MLTQEGRKRVSCHDMYICIKKQTRSQSYDQKLKVPRVVKIYNATSSILAKKCPYFEKARVEVVISEVVGSALDLSTLNWLEMV
jgi:hypothetical protein